MSFKWAVFKFRNLLIKNTCKVGLIKKNGEAYLFLQELLEWYLELHFVFFERHLHFLSKHYNGGLQIPAYFRTLSLRLTEVTVTLHVPPWRCCQQLWIHCQHTAAQVGLPFLPSRLSPEVLTSTTTARTFLGARRPRSRSGTLTTTFFPYINCWKSWVGEREKPFFELVPDQILHLLAQCWFDSSLHRGCKWLSVRNPCCLLCNSHK